MSNKTDRDTAIRVLRERQERLTGDIKKLHEKSQAIDQSIKLLLQESDERTELLVEHKALPDLMAGPQAIVEQFLRGSPGQFFRPRELARQIVKQGYEPKNPKLWPTQVNNCLKRAVEKNIADIQEVEDKKEYGLKLNSETISQDKQ